MVISETHTSINADEMMIIANKPIMDDETWYEKEFSSHLLRLETIQEEDEPIIYVVDEEENFGQYADVESMPPLFHYCVCAGCEFIMNHQEPLREPIPPLVTICLNAEAFLNNLFCMSHKKKTS
jgi:hypothetical protein